MTRIRGVAHRGYPARYPENTLPAFRAAIDLDFSIVELDVHLSKDGIPVVIHDYRVDRVTDGRGEVGDLTLSELKKLRVHNSEEIPTLEEALELLKGRATISIELKQAGSLYPGLEEVVLKSVMQRDMLDQVYLLAFDQYSLLRARELNKDVELGINIGGVGPFYFEPMKRLSVRYLAVPIRYLTDTLVNKAQEEEVQLITWPVDTPEQMERIRRYPSVLPTTNELERWRDFYLEHFGS